jgi:hypothetical protein
VKIVSKSLFICAMLGVIHWLASSAPAYVLIGSQWPQPGGDGTPITLTYSYQNMFDGVLKMPNNQPLPQTLIRNSIEEALGLWASVAPIHFVEVPDDGLPYTSATQYGTIRFQHLFINGPDPPPPADPVAKARAYYPSTGVLGGDVDYDHGDRWQEVGTLPQPDILGATVHELGHSLGLGHSALEAANMYWIFNRSSGLGTAFLHQDDIDGIRAIYGAGTGSVTPLVGTWQDRPYLPQSAHHNVFEFSNVPSDTWVDPPLVSEFRYVATDGTLFSDITEFPADFETPFTLSVDGNVLGQFEGGDDFSFASYPGGGVSEFVISGIDPLVDSDDPMGFPLKIAFTTPTGSFRMIASVPEPGTLAMLIITLLAGCLGRSLRRPRT